MLIRTKRVCLKLNDIKTDRWFGGWPSRATEYGAVAITGWYTSSINMINCLVCKQNRWILHNQIIRWNILNRLMSIQECAEGAKSYLDRNSYRGDTSFTKKKIRDNQITKQYSAKTLECITHSNESFNIWLKILIQPKPINFIKGSRAKYR